MHIVYREQPACVAQPMSVLAQFRVSISWSPC
jgi:hypothetical protein